MNMLLKETIGVGGWEICVAPVAAWAGLRDGSGWEAGRKLFLSAFPVISGPTSGLPTIRTLARSQAAAFYRHLAP